MLRQVAFAALVSVTLGVISLATAESYPDRPIRVVIGFAPGGPTDALGRVLFKKISEELGVPVVLENKPGAGGNIAASAVAAARPDGYTLMYASVAITIAPALNNREDLNPKRIFAAIGCSSAVPLIMLTRKDIEADTAQKFFDLVRARPGKYLVGNSGNGTIDQLAAADLASRLDLKFGAVPYKGNGPALIGLLAGDTHFMYAGAFNSALPFIENGDVKALAVTSGGRSAVLPDVPTLQESVAGLKDFNAEAWQAIVAPRGTPTAVLEKVNQALRVALKDPQVLTNLRAQGAEIMDTTPTQCEELIGQETDRWTSLIDRLGLRN